MYTAMECVRSAERVLVLTGAGISTNPPAGIPDYKSSALRFTRDEIGTPEWNAFVARCRAAEPTATHRFVADLHEAGKLVRVYTQNVDGLFARTPGLPAEKVVEFHGSVERPSDFVFIGEKPLDKPGIREQLRADFVDADPDLLLVLGTSLEMPPFMWLPNVVGHDCARIFVNKDLTCVTQHADNFASVKGYGYYSSGNGFETGYRGPVTIVRHRKTSTYQYWTSKDMWQRQYLVQSDCDAFCKQVFGYE